MSPQPQDLTRIWTGWVVHRAGRPILVYVDIDDIQESGFLHGTFSFPDGGQPGGEFIGRVHGNWIYITVPESSYHREIHFHVEIVGGNKPTMIFGAVSRAAYRLPSATIAVFPGREGIAGSGVWPTILAAGE
jgi:hypothetical protein